MPRGFTVRWMVWGSVIYPYLLERHVQAASNLMSFSQRSLPQEFRTQGFIRSAHAIFTIITKTPFHELQANLLLRDD
jgi:hypothetical protein